MSNREEKRANGAVPPRSSPKAHVRRMVTLGICGAVALLLSYVEFLLPPLWPSLPYVKCGLANLAVVFALYWMGWPAAAVVALLKVGLTALLFGSPISLLYSAAGTFLSLAVMALSRLVRGLSPVGVSALGGVAHNLGQVTVAVLVFRTPGLWWYMAIFTFTGTVSGVLIGLAAGFLLGRMTKIGPCRGQAPKEPIQTKENPISETAFSEDSQSH